MQAKYSLKFTFTASIKVILFNALGDIHKPSDEKVNIQLELNKNAKKKLFLVFFVEQINPLSIITGS